MIERTELEEEFFERLVEENMRLLVMERSGGLSEESGAPGQVIHHILGRNKPRGFKDLPEILQDWWPHAPVNCIVLTRAEHRRAHRSSKKMRPMLLSRLLVKYPDRIWEGKTYREWLNEPPFKEWL